MHRTLAIFALSLVMLAGADWPRFRGPAATGVSADKGLPTTWSATENVVWKTAMPGFGASSPITLGDKVFVTCYSGYGMGEDEGSQDKLMHHVVCCDRATGKILWDQKSKAELPEQEYSGFVKLHGYASQSLATDGERLYAFFGRSGARAYTLDGEPLWTTDVGDGLHGWGSANSPILYDDLVIINASIESQSVVALNKKTGKEVWRVEGIVRSWSTPLLVDVPGGKTELVVSVENKLLGLDPATGKQLWKCDSVQDYVCPAVIANNGIVYVSGGRKKFTAAVKAGGRGDVTETHRLWTSTDATKVPTPLHMDGLLYWVDEKGYATCVQASDGELVYKERLSIEGRGGDKIYASMVSADDKLYVVTRGGGTLVLAPGREFKLLATNSLGDDSVFNATPAISNGQLLLRSDKYLYCIGK